MKRPDVATLLVAGCAAALAVGDVHLCRRGDCRLVTDVLRRPLPLACLLVTTAHVVDVLGPADPFRALARLITRSAPVA